MLDNQLPHMLLGAFEEAYRARNVEAASGVLGLVEQLVTAQGSRPSWHLRERLVAAHNRLWQLRYELASDRRLQPRRARHH
jgi:hypothetical protein